jgi:hypothetical protein
MMPGWYRIGDAVFLIGVSLVWKVLAAVRNVVSVTIMVLVKLKKVEHEIYWVSRRISLDFIYNLAGCSLSSLHIQFKCISELSCIQMSR